MRVKVELIMDQVVVKSLNVPKSSQQSLKCQIPMSEMAIFRAKKLPFSGHSICYALGFVFP